MEIHLQTPFLNLSIGVTVSEDTVTQLVNINFFYLTTTCGFVLFYEL
jgi:hypothetical protein